MNSSQVVPRHNDPVQLGLPHCHSTVTDWQTRRHGCYLGPRCCCWRWFWHMTNGCYQWHTGQRLAAAKPGAPATYVQRWLLLSVLCGIISSFSASVAAPLVGCGSDSEAARQGCLTATGRGRLTGSLAQSPLLPTTLSLSAGQFFKL